MKKYAIWNKKDPVIVPTGQVFTAEQWMERYPMFALEHITPLCAYGEINGGFAGTLGQMVQMYEAQGADFSACTTPEEKLAVIEAWDDAKEAEAVEYAAAQVANEERQVVALEAIAEGATSETTSAMNALLTGEEI